MGLPPHVVVQSVLAGDLDQAELALEDWHLAAPPPVLLPLLVSLHLVPGLHVDVTVRAVQRWRQIPGGLEASLPRSRVFRGVLPISVHLLTYLI